MFLTIITPTYNRDYTLKRLYKSLILQTDKDFEWVVINDGSIDNTENLIKSFQCENKIKIKYYSQKNGGKQRAHNRGVLEAEGELCICVDSDDALNLDAVKIAKKIWNGANQKNHIGILAKRGDFDFHLPICSDWPKTLKDCKMIELQEKYKFSGDTALFLKSSLLKEHLFIEFDNEKFVPEDSLYAELDNYGAMILCPEVIYYCEYLADGLTANYRQLLLDNPMGTSYAYYKRMLRSSSLIYKFKNAIVSQSFLVKSNRNCEFKREYYKNILFIAKICSPVYSTIKKIK